MPWKHGNALLSEISSCYFYARKFRTPFDSEPTTPLKLQHYPHPTPSLLGAKQSRTKWCHSSQRWGNNNILFSDDTIAATNKNVHALIDPENKLCQKGRNILSPVGIEHELPVYFSAVLACTSCLPGNCATLNFYKIIGILLQ